MTAAPVLGGGARAEDEREQTTGEPCAGGEPHGCPFGRGSREHRTVQGERSVRQDTPGAGVLPAPEPRVMSMSRQLSCIASLARGPSRSGIAVKDDMR